jgi:hypothetical protein
VEEACRASHTHADSARYLFFRDQVNVHASPLLPTAKAGFLAGIQTVVQMWQQDGVAVKANIVSPMTVR